MRNTEETNDQDTVADRPVLTLFDGRKLRADPGPCLWCGEHVETGRQMSGTTDPLDPAWQINGDFGCDKSPITDDNGIGDHSRPWDLAKLILERNAFERLCKGCDTDLCTCYPEEN